MKKLNLPSYDFNIKQQGNKNYIFDIIRKKYVVLTPEEFVRQNFIHYLINEKKYPASLISVEHFLLINNLSKRCDIVLFNNVGKPLIIVECKSQKVKISQKAFDQIARYCMKLEVEVLILTNGIVHYCCLIDRNNNTISNVSDIPEYDSFERTLSL